jgi:hypothetical protein
MRLTPALMLIATLLLAAWLWPVPGDGPTPEPGSVPSAVPAAISVRRVPSADPADLLRREPSAAGPATSAGARSAEPNRPAAPQPLAAASAPLHR